MHYRVQARRLLERTNWVHGAGNLPGAVRLVLLHVADDLGHVIRVIDPVNLSERVGYN